MTHTKGPWEVSRDGVPDWHEQYTVYSEEERVATVFVSKANARLISAAPDLLAALTDIALICEADIENVDGQEVLRLANEAIRKATGGQS